MSIVGNKRRRIDCATLDVGADAKIGDDLYVGDNLAVNGTVTASHFAGGTLVPTSLQLPDGSAASPSLNFVNGPATGIYRDTTGTAGFAITTGGTQRLKINNSGAVFSVPISAGTDNSVTCSSINVNNGSSLHPSLSFTTEPTLGIRRGGTGSINFCANNDDSYVMDTTQFDTKGKSILCGAVGCTSVATPITTTTALTLSGGTARGATYLDGSKNLTTSVLTNGQLLVGRTGDTPIAATLTGTTNRVSVTNGSGSITLSTPQDINTSSSVTFGTVTSSTTAVVGTSTTAPNGSAKLHIGGNAGAVVSSPNIICYTGNDVYPLLHIVPFAHNEVEIDFDCWRMPSGIFHSSSSNSNFRIHKGANNFGVYYASGNTAGNTFIWNLGTLLDTSGTFSTNSLNVGGQLTSTGQPALYLTASGNLEVADDTHTNFNLWNTASTQGGITVTSNRDVKVPSAGNYMVNVTMIFGSGTPGGMRLFYVKKNGSITPYYALSQQAQTTPMTHCYNSSQLIQLAANDTLTVGVYQTNGGSTLNIGTFDTTYVAMFSIVKLF